jgi:hypothetical protein
MVGFDFIRFGVSRIPKVVIGVLSGIPSWNKYIW